jgi:hypothetical protein
LSDGIRFDTREEAEQKVAEFIKEPGLEEKRRIEFVKDNDKKSYSWNAATLDGERQQHAKTLNITRQKLSRWVCEPMR